jgi:hypothetical protein
VRLNRKRSAQHCGHFEQYHEKKDTRQTLKRFRNTFFNIIVNLAQIILSPLNSISYAKNGEKL